MKYPSKHFWEVFKATPGALSCAEAIAIANIAELAPIGNYMEAGSHKGKSGMAASVGLPGGTFYLIDPIFEDETLKSETEKLVAGFNEALVVNAIAEYSTNVISKYGQYAYFFWDSGEHGGEVLKRETELLEDAIVPGGIICSHDIGNQFTQQTDAMQWLVNTGKYEWIPIEWQPIYEYVKKHNLEDGNNSWHVYPDLPHPPNFVGAIRRK